jgi:ankyrin repeat protein
MKLLIKKKAELNICDKLGNTALMYAAEMGNDNCIQLLTENEAIVCVKNIVGVTAIEYATYYKHDKCVEYLMDAGAGTRKSVDEIGLVLKSIDIATLAAIIKGATTVR